jgi:hypothetical protein
MKYERRLVNDWVRQTVSLTFCQRAPFERFDRLRIHTKTRKRTMNIPTTPGFWACAKKTAIILDWHATVKANWPQSKRCVKERWIRCLEMQRVIGPWYISAVIIAACIILNELLTTVWEKTTRNILRGVQWISCSCCLLRVIIVTGPSATHYIFSFSPFFRP